MTKKIKYSEALRELQAIVESLEAEQVDVDEVAEKVKKAVILIGLCRGKIEQAEFEVKRVVKEFDKKPSD